MKKACTAVLVGVVLLLAGTTWAGVITPTLESQMQSLNGDDELKVLVVLRDQADIDGMNRQLHDGRATRERRHQAVLGALQDAAQRSQGALTDYLDARQRDGAIRGYTPHWLINAVVVVGTVDAIREIALRDDVEAIEPDLRVELIEPIEPEKPVPPGGHRGIGMTPGVEAIQAPRVWRELGIDGTGVVVGNMDTGVDGNHPALAARWRGLFADPSACWLDNSGQGTPDFPVDNHYLGHGTHVMGTITGLAPDDTIGVAPGALWIAANTINQGVGAEFDNDVIASLEWFADPDGNPSTTDDVPCVVQNSWGVYGGLGYPDCYSYWWDAIDNCEAAGVVLTWSAGNEGPYAESLRSPADRADSPYNAFSVGSTQNYAPFEISNFSSRGPSACGGPYAMKPEVCAPGSNIYSASPGGGYRYLDGTSMAGPHVAGVVALMCAANPDIDVETIKQVLMETAVDLGTPGEDNTYGHGFIDAYEAVMAVAGGLGTVSGTVTDADTGLPLAGVQVGVIDRPVNRVTDADGNYQFMLPVGQWTLTFEAFGYGDETLVVEVLENQTVDGSVTMTALPTAVLSGLVYDFEGGLVAGAEIRALDTPLDPVYSNGAGFYSLELPAGATYDVVARAAGYGADQHTIDFQGDMTLDFTLPELIAEDFETGDFLVYPWVMGGDADWIIDAVNPYEGLYSARSGDVGNYENSDLEVTVEVVASGDISFWYRVSSESNYDYLRFYVDGAQVASWSGTVPWTQLTHPVSAGTRTFKWSYTKDQSVSTGEDAGWVDFIEFPTLGEIPYPSVTITPTSVEQTVAEGSVAYAGITLGNVGEADLEYSVSIQYQDGPGLRRVTPAAPYRELEKGEADVHTGEPPVVGLGGPDGFGYGWIDSDEAGGPIYDWQEISGIGVAIGGGDDENLGPFPLGFGFSFYGQTYNSIRICTNGWLSFTSTDDEYSNQPIPNAAEPNTMLAPFWDDLVPNVGGTIYYYADAANDRFIVQWDAVPHYPSGSPETFEVILDADGTITYQYQTVVLANSCTVGIENAAGTDGLQVVYNAGGYLHNGLAIRFAVDPSMAWLSVSPSSGTLGPQGHARLDLTMDATELDPGEYQAELLLASNDPGNPVLVIPVALTVSSTAGVAEQQPRTLSFFGAVPNPFNPSTGLRFDLPADGNVELRIYDVAGRLVRSLLSGSRPAGANAVHWNGKDDAGRAVASGTYFARLIVDGQVEIKSLTLVR
jgi:subtilisin family serine protease